jgi:hypothetical protein
VAVAGPPSVKGVDDEFGELTGGFGLLELTGEEVQFEGNQSRSLYEADLVGLFVGDGQQFGGEIGGDGVPSAWVEEARRGLQAGDLVYLGVSEGVHVGPTWAHSAPTGGIGRRRCLRAVRRWPRQHCPCVQSDSGEAT